MGKVYVVGHKNPDTDSIVGAITLSYYLNKVGIDAEPVRLGELNNETKFVLHYSNVENIQYVETLSVENEIFLVDHNERSQTVDNFEELILKGVVDHHNIGNLSTPHPIFMRVEPVGSSATIISKMMLEKNISIPVELGKLLLSAIISDTLHLNSPTATRDDAEMLKYLKDLVGIDNTWNYALEMFKAKSDLSGKTPREIITGDYKEYEMGDKKVGIGVWETTVVDPVMEIKNQILDEMSKIKSENNLDYLLFSVVDILNKKNYMFIVSDAEADLVKKVFDAEVEDDIADLGSRVSRKKQIVPDLNQFFS